MDGLVKWFFRIFLSAMLLRGGFLLWKHAPYVLVTIIVVALAIWWSIHQDNQRQIRRGYWVEYLSPGRLRDGNDDCALIYHEGNNSVTFYGKERNRGRDSIIFVPSSSAWPTEVSEWAKDHREIFLTRIQQEKKFIQIETKPDPPTV